MNRLTKSIASGATVLGFLLATVAMPASTAFADGTGQIEGGAAIYQVKNLTTGSAYGDSTTASACDELQYKVRLHNSGFTAVNNINVKVDLSSAASTSNTSTMTATYTDGIVPSTSDTTAVTFAAAQSISYEAGTTQLFDGNNTLVKTEADGVVGSGLGLGSLGGSTTEYLYFKAKVNCPTPPPPTPVYTCDAFDITTGDNRKVTVSNFKESVSGGATFKNVVVAWGDNSSAAATTNPIGSSHTYSADGTYTIAATASFDVNGHTVTATGPQCERVVTFKANTPPVVTPPTVTPPAPTTLVNTGAGNMIGLFALVAVVGTFAHRFFLSRKLSN